MSTDLAAPVLSSQLKVLVRPPACGVEHLASRDVELASEMAVRLLPASLLAQLGTRFMAAFYAAALSHPSTVAFKAVDSTGQAVGFCLASTDAAAFQLEVRPRIAVAMLKALLQPTRWKLWPSFVRGAFEAEPQPHIEAELLLLYVDHMCQRQGSGRELLKHLEIEFKRRGVHRYRVAVRAQLTSAKAFYQATGFAFEQERQVLGEPMTYFVRDL